MIDTAVRERIVEVNPEALFCDGLDHALIGYVERYGMKPVALYDARIVIDGYIAQGMTLEEAEEFFDFNVIGSWMGEDTPAFATLERL